MPRTFLIRSNAPAVQYPGMSNIEDIYEAESLGTIVHEEGPYLNDDVESDIGDGPIDLSTSRSTRLRASNQDKSTGEIRGNRPGPSRYDQPSFNVPKMNYGGVRRTIPTHDRFPLPTTYKHQARPDLCRNPRDWNISQNFNTGPKHQYALDVSTENGCFSTNAQPDQIGDVHREGYPSRHHEEHMPLTSGAPQEESWKRHRFSKRPTSNRLFSLEGLTQIIHDETGMQPSRATCMSLLKSYYAEAIAKRDMIGDLLIELQTSNLHQGVTRDSTFLSSRNHQYRKDTRADGSGANHMQMSSGPYKDITLCPTLKVFSSSGKDTDFDNRGIKLHPSEKRIAFSRNPPPIYQEGVINEGSVGSEPATPPVLTPQGSASACLSPSDSTCLPSWRLPPTVSQSISPGVQSPNKTNLRQQYLYPTSTPRARVLSQDVESTNMTTLQLRSIGNNCIVRELPQFIHQRSTASSTNVMQPNDVRIPPKPEPTNIGGPQSSVPVCLTSAVPTSTVYGSALPTRQNPTKCQEGCQLKSMQGVSIIPNIANDAHTPAAYDTETMSSHESLSNRLTTQAVSIIPTPNIANDAHTPEACDTESMSSNEPPSHGLTTPDSTSLSSAKPPYSVAGGVPFQPTPASSSKPKLRCNYCLSTFPTERAYTKHMTTDHSQIKPHICGFCAKGFHDKFDLKRHYRTHTGVRPYKCSLCSRSFTQRCSLETHVNKVHGKPLAFTFKERREKIYVCEDCGNSVNDAFEHYLHMWTVHSRLAMPKRLRQKVIHRIKYILKPKNGGDKNEEELLADAQVVTQSICQVKMLSFRK